MTQVQKLRSRSRGLPLPQVDHYIHFDNLSSSLIIVWIPEGLSCYVMPMMSKTFSPILLIYMELYLLLKNYSTISSFFLLDFHREIIMLLAWSLFTMYVYLSDAYIWW